MSPPGLTRPTESRCAEPVDPRSTTLSRSSESHAGLPERPRQPAIRTALPVQHPGRAAPAPASAPDAVHAPAPHRFPGLARFNALPPADAEAALLACCGSRRWARRLAAHRPYPDPGALLAAAEEAGYDMSPAELTEALAAEPVPGLGDTAPHSAHLALRAAHAAYESRFRYVFVICLDAYEPAERPDQVLAGIRARLGHDEEKERLVAADEMRRLARGRLIDLISDS
ncbi:2-oxo-4-hydroxy-4-carboxy-5-ureidoimidazoline decarboxylase [Streptomyces sp. NPDC002476]|uniref:2-oxo-4-hydroxy-4-carboxy-5-ureidoimidazoline decarboxylase n=1 Tax=Streptomyces sp. NPDC002476 TaxID=3364648 RepID=UPI0036A8836B